MSGSDKTDQQSVRFKARVFGVYTLVFCLNPLLVKSFECLSKNWWQHAGFINWGKTVWQKAFSFGSAQEIKRAENQGYFYFYFRKSGCSFSFRFRFHFQQSGTSSLLSTEKSNSPSSSDQVLWFLLLYKRFSKSGVRRNFVLLRRGIKTQKENFRKPSRVADFGAWLRQKELGQTSRPFNF